MASELRVTTIANNAGSESVNTTYVVNGSAKAWVNFNGTGTVAARDSLNFSSLTDEGTGDYTVTISNAMGNTDYSCGGSSQQNVAGTRGDFVVGLHSTAQTTTTRRLSTVDSGGTATDALVVNLQIFGDLA
jgi:hypothetical protein